MKKCSVRLRRKCSVFSQKETCSMGISEYAKEGKEASGLSLFPLPVRTQNHRTLLPVIA